MKAFETFKVLSTNIDVNDGKFVITLYTNLESVINAAKTELEDKQASNIVEDNEDKLMSEYYRKLEQYRAWMENL